MSNARWLGLALGTALLGACPALGQDDLPRSRKPLLSFTYQPPDWSPEAFKATYAFIDQHADMIAHFMDDGVPWPEALAGKPFPPALEENVAARVAARRPGQRVLLAVNPVSTNRNDLAKYFGESDNLPLPAEWSQRSWSDPQVAQAYLAYVKRLATRLKPDYLCYAFEVNSNWSQASAAEWRAFLGFLRQVRDGLRAAFPKTPLVLEVVLGDDDYMASRWKHTEALFEFADVVSVSSYPYLFESVAGNEATVPANWFRRLKTRLGTKRMAVQETGFLGSDFHHPTLGVKVPGRGEKKVLVLGDETSQASYVRFLLREAQALELEFVNWWAWRDLDKLWERIKGSGMFADPMAAQWNHTGLQDAAGKPRPAQQVWDSWRAVPLAPR